MAFLERKLSAASSIGSLREQEEIEVRKALDLEYSIAIELRRRELLESERGGDKIQPNHLAFVSAYPLRKFIYETFPILEPGREYKDNWHIDCISEMLEAATVGQIKKIVINLPRRCMKSSLVSVMWFCWTWTFLPWTRWLYASFSEKFAYRDSQLCRRIIGSHYYQQKFGSVFQLSLLQNTKAKFENTKGGSRECFGVGKGTGSGGDVVVVDDPHEIDAAESEKKIESTINWYFETYYNNVLDPETAVRAIMHQRVSEQDLTGEILARELNYEFLCLPMRYEDDHPHKNSISKPLKLGKVSQFEHNANPTVPVNSEKEWIDPRDPNALIFDNAWYRKWYKESFADRGLITQSDPAKAEGDILWPNRFTNEKIDEMILHLKAYGESSQLQQRPIRRGGNFFNVLKFSGNMVDAHALEYNGMSFCRYYDKAGTSGGGDWTVGMLMGRTAKRPYTLYIIDIVRVQVGLYERMELMKRLAEEDTANYIENRLDTEYTIGIERELASSGKDVATIEKDHLLGYNVVTDIPKGKKAHRANIPKNVSDGGRIKVVKAAWNDTFFRELQKFDPLKENQVDDQIDTLSGATKLLIFGQVARGGRVISGTI